MPYAALARAVLGGIIAVAVPLASAQGYDVTYVSKFGNNDGITCQHQHRPCLTLQRAHNRTDPGGTIVVLDSMTILALEITKSIRIIAVGDLPTFVNVRGTRILVNAPPDGVVFLDRLRFVHSRSFDPASPSMGIRFNSGARLHVRDCSISGFSSGIRINAPGSSEVVISNCTIEGNTFGISARRNGGSGALGVLVDNTTLTANNTAIYADGGGGGTHIRINGSRIVGNHYGIRSNQNGRLISFGNNVIERNGTNGQPTHSANLK